ncbi:hypothetical protein ACFY9G_22000 [Streptomyces anthocyanicus]|uniref:hypothetical protein n=1 Tax=Streptomyces anthocyanicus TaxID=68174 RepID=UPI0036EFFA98
MKNVPSQNRHVAIARHWLADTDALDYSDLTDRDLCRLIGRAEVIMAHLITVIEDTEDSADTAEDGDK